MANLKSILKFSKYLRPYLTKIILNYLLSFLISGIRIFHPIIYMVIIDTITSGKNIKVLIYLIVIYSLLMLFQNFLQYIEKILSIYCKNFILLDLKLALFNHIQKLPLTFFSKETPAKLINRITNDVNAFSVFIDGSLKNILNNIISIIGIVTIANILGMEYIVIVLAATIVSFLITFLFLKKQKQLENDRARNRENIYNTISETLTAIDLIKISRTHDKEAKKFYNTAKEQISIALKSANLGYLTGTFDDIIDIGLLSFVFIYGGYKVLQGFLSVGSLLAIYQYVNQLRSSLSSIYSQYTSIKFSMGIIERVLDVFQTPPEELDSAGKIILPKQIKNNIRFENVSFYYDNNKYILHNSDLVINQNDTVLLTGPSGFGKTTVIKLLLRYLTPSSGTIYIDNYDIQNLNLDSYRKLFSVVLQETRLFSGTIRENICYGPSPISEDEMIRSAKISQIHEDILSLENGYDTVISSNQTELSVGQRQRLSLARAIAKNPQILILDEATGALDSTTDRLIMESLIHVFNNRTNIIISHKYINPEIVTRILYITGQKLTEISVEDYKRMHSMKI